MDSAILYRDPVFPPDQPQPGAMSLRIAGKRGALLSLLYTPGGMGLHPAVLLCHGYPGSEQNLDLAQALRRVGFAVMTFHYSGSWNSEGDFSFTNCLEDSHTVLDAMIENADAWQIDPKRLFVVGHSMGGLMAGHLLADCNILRGGVLITPFDVGRLFLHRDEEGCRRNLYEVLSCGYGWLNGVSEEGFDRELTEHAQELAMEPLAPKLAQKPLLCIGATEDVDTPIAHHVGPLSEAIKKQNAADFTYTVFETDHGFNNSRLTLCQCVTTFLYDRGMDRKEQYR